MASKAGSPSARAPARGPEQLRFVSHLREEPWKHDFFAVARRFEAGSDGPGFGRSATPAQDPVRFGQSARMAFSPRAIDGLESVGGKLRLRLLFSGLFGPNGPMPYHLTDFISDRRQHHGDATVEAFADIFHHRFFSLFYRAWADTDPVVSLDTDAPVGGDVFEKFVGAVGGTYGLSSHDFHDHDRRFYMGQIGPSASRPESLEHILSDSVGADVRINEFQGSWLSIEADDRLRIGASRLGDGSVLGSEVWSRDSAFEIAIGPLDPDDYDSFVPGGDRAALVDEIVTAVVGLELEWSVRLLRKGDTIDGASLDGSTRLGFSGWMGDIHDEDIRADLSISDARFRARS